MTSTNSVSNTGNVSTDSGSDSRYRLNVKMEYKEGLTCFYISIDCISNTWTVLKVK